MTDKEKLELAELDILSLTNERDALEEMVAEQKAEIKRLEGILNRRCDVCPVVTTAVNEFAEMLKAKADSGFWQEHSYVSTDDIDNLVKEMVEE